MDSNKELKNTTKIISNGNNNKAKDFKNQMA